MGIRLLVVAAAEKNGREVERGNTENYDWAERAKGMRNENGAGWKRGWGWCFRCL